MEDEQVGQLSSKYITVFDYRSPPRLDKTLAAKTARVYYLKNKFVDKMMQRQAESGYNSDPIAFIKNEMTVANKRPIYRLPDELLKYIL